jgi:YgiT-type zinc finger domain-containing protein
VNRECRGCSGTYEERLITRAFRRGDDVVVLDSIPAEVCDICGDTLLAPDTARHIEQVLKTRGVPTRTVPLYVYA